MRLICLIIFFSSVHKISFCQTVFHPFPQHVKYSNGVILPDNISDKERDSEVCKFYDRWKERYINDDAGEGQYYIWVEGSVRKNKSVSEGQGYGMIIVALMAGYDTTAQQLYNGLFKYYKLHPSRNNTLLMGWAQNSSFKNIDTTSASDGDIDIAYSLLLADKQWGSNGSINYFSEAVSLITAIVQDEINHKTYSVLLSNSVESDSKDYFDMRSSDFMPAHFKAFKNATKDSTWNKVINSNYKLFNFLQVNYSDDAGLLPDFIQHINNTPVPARSGYLESKYDGSYNYNACRVPWRIATDYIINGDDRSKKIVEKINKWIQQTTSGNPDNISAGYNLEGDDLKTRNFEAMSFISSFAVSAMVDSKNQKWLNNLWGYIVGFDIDQYDYYDNSIKMLELIIISGNYWSPSHEK